MALDVEALGSTEQEHKARKHRPLVVRDARLKSLGYAQKALTVSGQDVPINTLNYGGGADGMPQNASIVIINVEAGSIRYRDDGGQCDANTGELWAAGSVFERTLMTPTSIHVAGVGTSSVVNISVYTI